MNKTSSSRFGGSFLCCLLVLLPACLGCHLMRSDRTAHPNPYVPPEIPREQAKVTLPDYIIEPPDILSIAAINLVPKSPYSLKVFDVVSVAATGLSKDAPITGQYTIQPNGSIQLGYDIGSLPAAGLTVDQLQQSILQRLEQIYTSPSVWVTLLQIGEQQQISGEHLVSLDGKVNLGSYGRVRVVGLTIEEAEEAVEAHLSSYLEQPEIAIDVLGYNSKVYYVVTQGAGLGDQVIILPARGNETVLDAIGQIQGLQSNSSTHMWIARPGHNECGGDQIMPVDWLAVTQRGDTTTNYQILPGDRLYVAEDKLVALDTALGKIISPIERVFGVTLLGTDTVQRIKFFNNPNSGFGGF